MKKIIVLLSLLLVTGCSTKVEDAPGGNGGGSGGGGPNPPQAELCLDLNATNQNQSLPCACPNNFTLSSDGKVCSQNQATVGSIVLSASTLNVLAGSSTPIGVEVRDTDGNLMDESEVALSYSVTPSVVGTVTNGQFSAQTQGAALVTASAGGVASNPLIFTVIGVVSNETIDHITVTPLLGASAASYTLNKNETRAFVALAYNSSNQVLNKTISWSSSAPAIAQVSGGLVTALAVGNANITASAEGVNSSPLMIAVVDQSLINLNLDGTLGVDLYTNGLLGQTSAQLTGVLGMLGVSPLLNPVINFQSLTPGLASVDASGLVTANPAATESGVAEIKASVNVLGLGLLSTVIKVNVYAEEKDPTALVLPLVNNLVSVGQMTAANVVSVVDQLGKKINNQLVQFYSSNPLVATVDVNGRVLGINPGVATIIAVGPDGLSTSFQVTVTQ